MGTRSPGGGRGGGGGGFELSRCVKKWNPEFDRMLNSYHKTLSTFTLVHLLTYCSKSVSLSLILSHFLFLAPPENGVNHQTLTISALFQRSAPAAKPQASVTQHSLDKAEGPHVQQSTKLTFMTNLDNHKTIA